MVAIKGQGALVCRACERARHRGKDGGRKPYHWLGDRDASRCTLSQSKEKEASCVRRRCVKTRDLQSIRLAGT